MERLASDRSPLPNSYIRKFSASPLPSQSSVTASISRSPDLLSHTSSLLQSPNSSPSLLQDPEISFSKDAFQLTTGSSCVQKPASKRTSSASSAGELMDLGADIRKMLRGVLAQVNPATPTLSAGSYSSNMTLKRMKDKLEGLERFSKALDERRIAIEGAEEQIERKLTSLYRKEREIEEREQGLLHTDNERFHEMEIELSETKALLQMYRKESPLRPDSGEKIKKKLTFEETETDDFRQIQVLGRFLPLADLRETAEQLEEKTTHLIQVEKELENKVNRIQAQDLDERFRAILAEEEGISEERGALEVRDSEIQLQAKLLEQKKTDFAKYMEREMNISVVKGVISDLLDSTITKAAEKHETAIREHKETVENLLTQLTTKVSTVRTLKDVLQTQSGRISQLQTDLENQQISLSEAQAKVSEDLSYLKEGKIDALIRRRDETVHKKESVFNEKLTRFRERKAKMKEKDQELTLREAKIISLETGNTDEIEGGNMIESLKTQLEELEAKNKGILKREKELKALETQLKARASVLQEQEQTLQSAVEALEQQKTKVKKTWEAAKLKFDQARNWEAKLETMKTEFAQKQAELIENSPGKTVKTRETAGKSPIRDRDRRLEQEIQRLKSELRIKSSEFQIFESRFSDVSSKLASAEEAIEEKDKEIGKLKTAVFDLRKKRGKAGDGVNLSPTADDFTQIYKQRQKTLLDDLNAADKEKREMSQALHDFLSDLR